MFTPESDSSPRNSVELTGLVVTGGGAGPSPLGPRAAAASEVDDADDEGGAGGAAGGGGGGAGGASAGASASGGSAPGASASASASSPLTGTYAGAGAGGAGGSSAAAVLATPFGAGRGLFGPLTQERKEMFISKRTLEREAEYVEMKRVQVFCGSWNVNAKAPQEELTAWLTVPPDFTPDVYAVGFQEVDMSATSVLTNDISKGRPWEEKIEATLKQVTSHKYVHLLSKQLVGILLCIYVKKQHIASITNIDSDSVGTGILGMMGNKGGSAIRFNFYDTSLVFVTSHLAAHMRDTARRNQDHQEITRRISFVGAGGPSSSDFGRNEDLVGKGPLGLHDHDHVFWFGDLNYRIPLAGDEIKTKVGQSDWKYLIDYDQLKLQQQAGAAFVDYEEGPIDFPPTYKYDPGTNTYDTSEKHRPPAWCDRILWKSRQPDRISQKRYASHMELLTSDHKPVSAIFFVDLSFVNKDKKRKVQDEVLVELNKLEMDHLPDVQLETNAVKFGDVRYGVNYQKSVLLTNTGPVAVRYSFVNRLNSSDTAPPWLVIATPRGIIQPGDKKSLIFNLYINSQQAQLLNNNPEKRLEDILVLQIEGGKDYFISVAGHFLKSCFGRSLEELCRIPGPVRSCLPQQLSTHPSLPLRVPKELWRTVDHLFRHSLLEEQLFMEKGLKGEVEAIRECLEVGSAFPEGLNNHSMAETLIQFLEDLTEPVIPYAQYQDAIGATTYAAAKAVVAALPTCNYQAFIYIVAFLREVLAHGASNALKPEEISLIFSTVMLSTQKAREAALQRGTQDPDAQKKANFLAYFLNEATDADLLR